ncbi:MAG: hypothetical protein SFV55_00290 [Haliscomenobacter sp.]|uniref:hypothetical protein n=1 Tax=Haliscomenobacter sp. TaxID=2717303 RepID=UPI0029B3416E|nr:hypothetical protein [Haliscomenobacter sp.]MDX2066825.1 hypothetical protein [Haliscomenobacter sp.]
MTAAIGMESKSEYELERGKPMPNKIHSLLQRRLTVFWSNQYAEQYEVFPELTFELPEENATPDLAIFVKEGMLRDEVLGIEMPMEKIFGSMG